MLEPILPAEDPYLELGLAADAADAEVRQAYFSLVRVAGPDQDPVRFKRERAAYERLSSPERRFETDRLRLQDWLPPAAGAEAYAPAADWLSGALT